MTAEEARWLVAGAFRLDRMEVYEGRRRPSRVPDLVVMDAETGALARVRVMVGKHPRRARRLSYDRRRVGAHADALALVDPITGSVDLRGLPALGDGETPRWGRSASEGLLPAGSRGAA